MGQLVVRGIPEGDMEALEDRARRLGRSREQEVRLLIARAAEEERGWAEFSERSAELKRRHSGRRFGDSAGLIRSDRDAR